jgi:transcriptional regulator with XRE-family HTH domain
MYNPELFRRARRRGGLTLREVGTLAELDASTIATYETERARPSINAAGRWEGALIRLLAKRVRETREVLNELVGDRSRP